MANFMKYYACQLPTGSGINNTNCVLMTESTFGDKDVEHLLVTDVNLLSRAGMVLPDPLTLILLNTQESVALPFKATAYVKKENENFAVSPPYIFKIQFV